MENLLSNSWKFTRKHHAPRIEFGKEQSRVTPVFYIRDNGAGFDMKYANKLFGAFERLHSPGEYEGHGIGLATVQRIVQRHGGHAWAEGRPGEGAIFYFTLSHANGSTAQL
jgi:light-regulated signal transduction histidine kinase (bacteriophytochrome)